MQNKRAMAESLYAAFGRRDAATILSLISPDIVIRQSAELPWGGEYSGHAGLQQFFANLLKHINSNVTVERTIESGDHVSVIGRTKGTVNANGKNFDVPVVHVWQVKDGKFILFLPFIENAMMLEALKD